MYDVPVCTGMYIVCMYRVQAPVCMCKLLEGESSYDHESYVQSSTTAFFARAIRTMLVQVHGRLVQTSTQVRCTSYIRGEITP